MAFERETINLRAAGITTETMGDLLAARNTDTDPLTDAVLEAVKTVTDTEQELVSLGERITSRVTHITEMLAEDMSRTLAINPLGELQSTGAQYDLACARLAAARAALATLARLWARRPAATVSPGAGVGA